MEAEFPAESEYNNQNDFLHELCLLEWLKDEYPNPPKPQKLPIFKRKNLEKSKVKFFLFFLSKRSLPPKRNIIVRTCPNV